jgi:hypothetical protein
MNPFFLKATGSSTFLLIIIFLVCIECTLRLSKLFELQVSGATGARECLEHKLITLMNSAEDPHVILTGSSLFLYPALRCDQLRSNVRARYDAKFIAQELGNYSKASCFEDALKKTAKSPLTVANLATGGELMSDQYLVLKHWIGSGKKPEYAICDLSPREFQDNWQRSIQSTTICKVLSDEFSLFELFFANLAGGDLRFLLNFQSVIYKDRAMYKEACLRNYGALFQLHSTLEIKELSKAEKSNSNDDSDKPIYDSNYKGPYDLAAYYKKTYLPLDKSMYKKELFFLTAYLKLAQEKNIKVLLVLMPLPRENLEMLPIQFREQFVADMKRIALQYKAVLVQPASQDIYTSSDFEDFAHLNAQGGQKLFAAIADGFASEQRQ